MFAKIAINLIIVFCLLTAASVADEITIFTPTLSFRRPGLTFAEKIALSGKIKSAKTIAKVQAQIASNIAKEKFSYNCDIYYLKSDRTTVMFQAEITAKAPYSLLIITVTHADGDIFRRQFILRTAYTNSRYDNDFCMFTKKRVHDEALRSVDFSRDNKYLVTASDDKTVKILDPLSLRVHKTLRGHIANVHRALITSDNRYVVSAGNDRTVKLWNVASGELVHTFRGHDEPVHALAVSFDGKYAASGAMGIRIWDLEKRRQKTIFSSPIVFYKALVFSEDGHYLFSGDDENSIRIWDLEDNKEVYSRSYHKGAIASLAVAPSRCEMYSGGKKGKLNWWKLLLNKKDSYWKKDKYDQKMWRYRIRMVKKDAADTDEEDYIFKDYSKTPVVALHLNSTGEYLLAAKQEGYMAIYETYTHYKIYSYNTRHILHCGAFAFDSTLVALGDIKGYVWVFACK